MDGKLTLTVVTPDRPVVSAIPCDAVTLPTERGEIGILPGHTALVTLLGIGLVTWTDGGKKTALAVRDGFAEIAGDVVRVLADRAVAREGVDRAAEEKAKGAAETRRLEAVGSEQVDAASGDIAFAEAQLALGA